MICAYLRTGSSDRSNGSRSTSLSLGSSVTTLSLGTRLTINTLKFEGERRNGWSDVSVDLHWVVTEQSALKYAARFS